MGPAHDPSAHEPSAAEPTARIDPRHARSWLLLSAAAPEQFDDAVSGPADAVILDLEDAVPDAGKAKARSDVVEWLSSGGRAWVRINDATTGFWHEDLDALAGAIGLEGVVLAKTESGQQVDATTGRIPGAARVIALVESAMGLEAAPEIARADATFRLAFGTGDFRRDTGTDDSPLAMAYPRARLTITSRAARLPGPIDGPTVTSGREDVARDARVTVSLGMTGKLCMNSAQAPPVNEALSPSVADTLWAHEVIARLGDDGRNITQGSDRPALAEAKKISARARMFGIG
ncbi:CoA ester lyase [Rhodococcus triatomae]|uniref:Citrate lyase subunit beta / citryl-CoA lyase n=1 Tax=Rhodococcus triatomae TaxID=300028 RepID=A0A1G8Q456_9NOCA|nr:CoA ester lyase [Rhodococcus triatomae]QNG24894.1 CoA ester lyase [Rhodococcus triatomae]SDI99235.1 citrate lyase subunit beta / citryl-CoA lyase [Rhodococcus triatomae]